MNNSKFIEKPSYINVKTSSIISNNPLTTSFLSTNKGNVPYSVFKPHSETIYFLASPFDGRPPTIFFPYPRYTRIHRISERVMEYSRLDHDSYLLAFRVNDSTHVYNAVVNSFKNSGFQIIEHSN